MHVSTPAFAEFTKPPQALLFIMLELDETQRIPQISGVREGNGSNQAGDQVGKDLSHRQLE